MESSRHVCNRARVADSPLLELPLDLRGRGSDVIVRARSMNTERLGNLTYGRPRDRRMDRVIPDLNVRYCAGCRGCQRQYGSPSGANAISSGAGGGAGTTISRPPQAAMSNKHRDVPVQYSAVQHRSSGSRGGVSDFLRVSSSRCED